MGACGVGMGACGRFMGKLDACLVHVRVVIVTVLLEKRCVLTDHTKRQKSEKKNSFQEENLNGPGHARDRSRDFRTFEDFWSSDAGAEFLDKWFSIPKICQYFRTRSPVTMADIDGWYARDIIVPLFFNDNTDLHNLIRKHLVLPYLPGSFHPSLRGQCDAYPQ